MFYLVHGPSSMRGKAVAVLFGYFDASGTHEGAKICTLCGFIAEMPEWEAFDLQWKATLDKPSWPTRPKEFHMYDCVHGYGHRATNQVFVRRGKGMKTRLAVRAEIGAKHEKRWTTGDIMIAACRIELADATPIGDKLVFNLEVL